MEKGKDKEACTRGRGGGGGVGGDGKEKKQPNGERAEMSTKRGDRSDQHIVLRPIKVELPALADSQAGGGGGGKPAERPELGFPWYI